MNCGTLLECLVPVLQCSAFKSHDLGLRPLLTSHVASRDEPMVVAAEEWHICHPGRQAEIREDLVCSGLGSSSTTIWSHNLF